MDTEHDLDRLCDDMQARARTLATEAKRLTGQPLTPDRRDRLQRLYRDMNLSQIEIRRLLQIRRLQ
jgi:hypothetical protein